MRTGIISPECSEQSASYLADTINADYLGQAYKETIDFSDYDILFNYGVSSLNLLNSPKTTIINPPIAVKKCVNKLKTLYSLYEHCNMVQFTEKPERALKWINEGNLVVARALTNSSQGKGLEYITNEEQLKGFPAKFWTKYFEPAHEVRINVFKGNILSVYEKTNSETEMIFTHLKITGDVPEVNKMVEAISSRIGVDFYGMDVLVSNNGEYKLLEINTAPILHKETAKAIKTYF